MAKISASGFWPRKRINRKRCNFSKGCYLGQEIVERVRSRGQIHRVLKPLTLETKYTASAWNKAGGCHGNYIRGVFAGDG